MSNARGRATSLIIAVLDMNVRMSIIFPVSEYGTYTMLAFACACRRPGNPKYLTNISFQSAGRCSITISKGFKAWCQFQVFANEALAIIAVTARECNVLWLVMRHFPFSIKQQHDVIEEVVVVRQQEVYHILVWSHMMQVEHDT